MPPAEEEAVGHDKLPDYGQNEGPLPAGERPKKKKQQPGKADDEDGARDEPHHRVVAQLYGHNYVFLRQR